MMQTDLNHNYYMIKVKGVPAATRSRALFLWLCLLCLYFLIVPGAADQRPVVGIDAVQLLSADTTLGSSALPGAEIRYRP